jgi:long-subunit acyl-CoA synthetase (AMP-forming)
MPATLPEVFAGTAARVPHREAIVARTGPVTFAALALRAEGIAATLQARGINPGDRCLVAMPVSADLFATLAALWSVGAVAVFPEPALGLRGLRHAIRATAPRALIASGAYRALRLLPGLWTRPCIRPRARRGPHPSAQGPSPEDPALISFTSGSTGVPKGIVRTHAFLMAQHAAVAPILASDREERDLTAFPVFTLVALAEGRTSILPDWRLSRPDRVTPGALGAAIARSGATRALLPPALAETLAQATLPPRFTTLFTGGGPVKPALVAALTRAHPALRTIAVYGSTEAEPVSVLDWSSVSEADHAAMTSGAGLLAGQPVPGLSLRIEQDEILVSGAHVNEGYLDPARDAETKRREAGRIWHRTGDAGRLDARGRLWLLGRHATVAALKDGAAVTPFGVELRAEQDPAVRRAALAEIGGTAVLAVELRPGMAHGLVPAGLGVARIVPVSRIPLDRRHRSKVDLPALKALIGAGS